MTALVRYLLTDLRRSQRWVAPMLAYIVVLALLSGGGGDPLSTAALGAAALFPLAAWLTWVASGCEDPMQEAVTATCVGGLGRARLAKGMTGATASLLLGSVTLVLVAAQSRFDLAAVAAAVAAVATNVVGGAALGFVTARAVVPDRGLSVLIVAAVCLAELIVPWFPPVRATLQALYAPTDLAAHLALSALATTVAAAALTLVGLAVALRRA